FAKDHETAFTNGDVCDLRKRHGTGSGRLQQDAAHRVRRGAGGLRVAHRDVETAVAFDHLRDRSTANRSLNCRIDIGRRNAVASGFRAVYSDDHAGLSVDFEHTGISHAMHLVHDLLDLIGEVCELGQIVAEQLQRVFAFYTAHRFLYVVLDSLRESGD